MLNISFCRALRSAPLWAWLIAGLFFALPNEAHAQRILVYGPGGVLSVPHMFGTATRCSSDSDCSGDTPVCHTAEATTEFVGVSGRQNTCFPAACDAARDNRGVTVTSTTAHSAYLTMLDRKLAMVGSNLEDLDSARAAQSSASAGDSAYFIRAPSVVKAGDDVEILATLKPEGDEQAVAVRQGHLMATCFHPEISSDDSWLQLFLKEGCGAETTPLEPPPLVGAAAPWAAAPEGYNAGSEAVKRAFAVFQKGGVIMDVVDGQQAKIAREQSHGVLPRGIEIEFHAVLLPFAS